MSDTMLPVGRGRRRLYIATLPERVVRAAIAVVGGAVHETAQLLLPRLVRRSRFYEATAKNLLRVAVELVGGVQGSTTRDPDTGARELAVRKGAGNIVELGSIAAFGFSPLWLLAGASDILRGSRVYLEALVEELKRADLLAPDVDVESVDDLLGVLERGTGSTARLIDIPPVELSELRRSLAELRSEGDSLPSPAELSSLFQALRRAAKAEERAPPRRVHRRRPGFPHVGQACLSQASRHPVSGRLAAGRRGRIRRLREPGVAAVSGRCPGASRRERADLH